MQALANGPCWCVDSALHHHYTITVPQAKANRGILYVDEVNLLDDGLVDVVLDSAASGVNTVEREGISIVHPARFIMIGSGNPSEVLNFRGRLVCVTISAEWMLIIRTLSKAARPKASPASSVRITAQKL